MKIISAVLTMPVIFAGILITSCQKQAKKDPATPTIQNNNNPALAALQISLTGLQKRCDSLSTGLAQISAVGTGLNTYLINLATQPIKINVASVKTQLGTVLTQIAALNTQVIAAASQLTSINTMLLKSIDMTSIGTQLEQSDAQLSKLKAQYTPIAANLQIAEQETETAEKTVLGSKSYIALATAQNVANYAGDVIACPGYYLSVYTHFYTSSSDIAPTFIAARKSIDTTGLLWGNEYTVSANIGKLNVSSVSLYRVDANTVNCYFLVKNSTADTRLYLTVSPDNGTTWLPPKQIIYEGVYDIFLNASIHTVNNGRMVIPIASDPDFRVGYVFSDYCYYSDDAGATWKKSGSITPPVTGGGLEPKIVQLSGDTCLMNLRTSTGVQYFSKSTDNCKTWGTPYKSTLQSPSAPAEIVNLSGKLVAIHNNSAVARNPLSISESLDRGATWTHIKDIETGSLAIYDWTYPSVTISNGYLLLSYYETINEPAPVSALYYNFKFNKIQISTLGL